MDNQQDHLPARLEHRIRRYYERNPEGIPGVPEIPEIFQAHQIFLRHLEMIDPDSVLDAGCGKGYLGEAIGRIVGNYTGLDFSSSAVRIARQRMPGRRVVEGDVLRLPFSDGEFDCVVCSEVLEHVPRYRVAVDELWRVTRRGGNALISTPNRYNPDMIWRICVYGKYTSQIYDRPVPHSRLAQTFEHSGFVIQSFFSFFFLPLWGERMMTALKVPLMSLQQRLSKITGFPLGLYLFYWLRKP